MSFIGYYSHLSRSIFKDAVESKDVSIVRELVGMVYAYHNLWISVDQKLPEEGETVFVRTKNGKVATSMRVRWQDNVGWLGNSAFTGSITHWMPIPELQD